MVSKNRSKIDSFRIVLKKMHITYPYSHPFSFGAKFPLQHLTVKIGSFCPFEIHLTFPRFGFNFHRKLSR